MNSKAGKGRRDSPAKTTQHIDLREQLNQALSVEVPPEVVERMGENPAAVARIFRSEHFEGPFPPPHILQQYNSILPGAAERIFALTEREQLHRHATQGKAIDGAICKDKRGQWMGFLITVFVLVIALFFGYIGDIALAGTLITVDLIGLAAVFVVGKSTKVNARPKAQDNNPASK